jgi:hypothetical protein
MRALLALASILAACGGAPRRETPAAFARPVPSAAPQETPVPTIDGHRVLPFHIRACDDYAQRVYACIWSAGFPAAERTAALESYRDAIEIWTQVAAMGTADATIELDATCLRAFVAARQTMASKCSGAF